MKTDSLMRTIDSYIDKKIKAGITTPARNSSYYKYGNKEITIGASEEGLATIYYDDELPKLAMGIIDDKDDIAIPLIAFGAGSGNGNNRGYISKGTDGLEMYYVGNLSLSEVGGLKLKKDGVYSTHKIIVESGLISEFVIEATTWDAKLEELTTKAILEDPLKVWNIASENLLDSDVAYWDAGGSESGAAAAAIVIIAEALNIVSDLPSTVTQGTFGIKAELDSTHYALLTGGGLSIVGGALSISSTSGDLMMSGAGIVADQIIAGIMTGFTIQTATSGARMKFNTNGIESYNTAGYKTGLWMQPAEQDFVDFLLYRGDVAETLLFAAVDSGLANTNLVGWGHLFGKCYADSFDAWQDWDFSNATVTGLAAVWG